MNKPDKAGEPSMDEILSSIRKIISEEPIGSGTASPSQETPRDSLGDVRMGENLLGVVADEPSSQNPARREPTLPAATSWQAANGNANGNHDVASEPLQPGGHGLEPKLPMPEPQDGLAPEEVPAAGRSLLSSRLAKVLGGTTTPSSPAATPPAETFDDEDLSAVLDDAALDVATPPVARDEQSQSAPAEASGDTAQNEVVDVEDTPSVELDATTPAPHVDKTPDPFADLGNVSVVASTQAGSAGDEVFAKSDDGTQQGATDQNSSSSVAKPSQEADSNDEARVTVTHNANGRESRQPPLFETGPQPPSSLRPRAFEASDLPASPSAESEEVVTQTETAAQTEAALETNDENAPMVIASMEKPIERPVAEPNSSAEIDPAAQQAEPAKKSPGAPTELVGLAAAVAARDVTQDDVEAVTPTPTASSSAAVPEPTVEAETDGAEGDVSVERNVGVSSSTADVRVEGDAQAMELAAAAARDPDATASISPAGVQTLEDTVAELLRPMLREWLSNNMPRIVEKALRIELASGLSGNLKSPDTAQIESDTPNNG